LLVVGKDNVTELVRETAIATLNSIIRSTSLAEVAQSKEITAKSEKKLLQQQAAGIVDDPNTPTPNPNSAPATPAPAGRLFFDKVHDEFISKLHDTFVEHYGITISNIRIESFKLLNQELASNISKQALVTAQTETQLSNLSGQTEIATAQQKRDAEVAKIRAEGEAARLKTETDARNRTITESAKTEAEATLIRAKSEASAMELRAQAEAKAILLKADAESKRSELIAKTPLGGQLALFQVYADMVKTSMRGVEKMVYLPSEAMNSPMAWMQSMGPGGMPMMNMPMGIGAPTPVPKITASATPNGN